jgi:tetratricopeptide (TPR) repeat protein
VEPLLLLEVDTAFLATVTNLFERSQQAPEWGVADKLQTRALYHYRAGRWQEALTVISEAMPKLERYHQSGLSRACMLFLRAAVSKKTGNDTEARQAYEEGLRFHSPELRGPGTPYTGDRWPTACTAELIRREVGALLGVGEIESARPNSP